MYRLAEQRLTRLINSKETGLLTKSQIGLEKESLRVSPAGKLAQTAHPHALGSPLTHPFITTDYSEALAELITPPCTNVQNALDFLRDTQRFVYSVLDNEQQDEMLWATSMPCVVAGETSIPIAQYGNSNAGIMKTVYRRGLGHRYGRVMQVISGVHFNYSFPQGFWLLYQELEKYSGQKTDNVQDFISASYFALVRNLQRLGWMVPYLFGASPAVCKSFLGGKPTPLESFNENTFYEPYATSLRMGDIGYQNNQENETGIKADYDSVDAYVASLMKATETPCRQYQQLGVVVDGRYEQLNANILQIENEYYSTIRPKQLTGPFEKPSHALKRRGVRYVELRSIDVNAYDPLGINEEQLRFLEAFLVFCLLHDSPPISAQDRIDIDHNELAVAHRGRDPLLHLHRNGESVKLKDWATDVVTAMAGVCELLLDQRRAGEPYSKALAAQRAKIDDPDKTPSARMLAEMRAEGEGFFHFALRMSEQHKTYFHNLSLPPQKTEEFTRLAERSWRQQQKMEAADNEPFDEYLRRYQAQTL